MGRRQRRALGGELRRAARRRSSRDLEQRDVYVIDAFCGADPKHRLAVRVVTAHPYHALFAKTMFIDPTDAELDGFEPDVLVLHEPEVEADPAQDGTRTEVFVCLHPTRRGDRSAARSTAARSRSRSSRVMNDRLPLEGVVPMHCSANVSKDGEDVAIFFGLSGTGKTTLSADPYAPAHRRRRARLGRRRRLQLRGRLLREDDPPLGRGRAGDLEGGAQLRHRARERRRRRARQPRPRRRLEDREHARRVQARADREHAAGEARRPSAHGRSSSPPTRSGSCRRSRGSAASRRCSSSSPASRRSSPAPSSA